MNYEFHVGDYVESRNGTVGYLTNVKTLYSSVVGDDIVGLDGALTADISCGFTPFSLNIATCDICKYFARIGAYDFTKKEKKKIESLDYNVSVDSTMKQLSALKNKINELVDAVNKLMTDYNDHVEGYRQNER